MNGKNKNIIDIIQTKIIILAIICITQIISLFMLIFFVNIFGVEMNFKMLILLFAIIICIILDVIFYKMHISRAKYFLECDPIECTIEDFILLSYGYTKSHFGHRRKEYRLYPVVKVDNKLFFTYGDYCVSHYNQRHIRANNNYSYIEIFRKDKSQVKIGDKAYLYIKKKLDINVDIDKDKNKFKLNRQNEYFNNFNKEYDIEILKNVNFFEGIIDIEYIE